MVVRPSWLRAGAAMFVSVLLLGLATACHKKTSSESTTTFVITGAVTYVRAPLHYNASGVPTGLETDASLFQTLPARGITVRAFQLLPQAKSDFTTTNVWVLTSSTTTDVNGNYSLGGTILKDYPTFVEVSSVLIQPGSPASTIEVIADPKGVYSSAQINDRPIYSIRKALDGTAGTASAQLPRSVGSADSVVDFAVGLTEPWYVESQRWWNPATTDDVLLKTPLPVVNAGSRVVAILDSCYYVAAVLGNAVPTSTAGELDLHYRPGLSNRRGTFMEFNSLNFPKSYDGSGYHYFGAISGGGTVDGVIQPDDAFDPGSLYPILCRNYVYGQRRTNMTPTGYPATSLAPDLALVEGFGDAAAAILIKSPYLPNTSPAAPADLTQPVNRYTQPRDIRDLSGYTQAQISPFSAPAISAVTWDMALMSVGADRSRTVTNWSTIDPASLIRFYTLLNPTMTSGTATVISDCVSLYTQMARLEEAKGSADTVDLALYFQDSTLTPLCATINMPWTTYADAILPKYTAYWGADPNTLVTPLPTFTLSMAGAQQIKRYYLDSQGAEQMTLYYPNNSKGEVAYALFATSLDRACNLKVDTTPPLPAGATIEIVIDGDLQNVNNFPGGTTTVIPLLMKGNPNDLSTPNWHQVRIRMVSPTSLVPDTLVTVMMEKTN